MTPYALPHQHPNKDLAPDPTSVPGPRAPRIRWCFSGSREEEGAQAGEGPQKADGGG